MAILPENRHISSFIGHVPHANSPFSFQCRRRHHRGRRRQICLLTFAILVSI